MDMDKYRNFVRSSSTETGSRIFNCKTLSGEEAKKLYLEEIKRVKDSSKLLYNEPQSRCTKHKKIDDNINLSDKDLFLSVQNNDKSTLTKYLDRHPDKIKTIDEYGWSLLMIACQANSIEIVQELLSRGADLDVRDKAGNSARSLVIKNKNFLLADILITHRNKAQEIHEDNNIETKTNTQEKYYCEPCMNEFPDKDKHLSSTIHNINTSKHKKSPPNYVIPSSNRGYQIMVKVGWDKESGLGPDGAGKRYPIKTVQKKDRKGLGKVKEKDIIKQKDKKITSKDKHRDKRLEIQFRREFY